MVLIRENIWTESVWMKGHFYKGWLLNMARVRHTWEEIECLTNDSTLSIEQDVDAQYFWLFNIFMDKYVNNACVKSNVCWLGTWLYE